MEEIRVYLFQIIITVAICLAPTAYLRPHLRHILVDLCGTPERAQFWVVFSSILLVSLPLVFSLGYDPLDRSSTSLFFDAARQVRVNLLGFIFGLIGIGGAVSFFALVAPRPANTERISK